MPHRYFTKEIADGTAVLRGADAHHLSRVMRARLGDTVILCDGNAVEYTAVITGFGDETVEFSVEEGYPSAAEPDVEVTLLVGYPKQDKLEQIIRHGVELGCAHFVPFFSRYCVAAPKKEEQKNERYNRIAFEAAKQCGRGVLPDVALPLPNFGAVCRTLGEYDLITANIVANAIISLAPAVPGLMAEDATFIASGIIDSRKDEVIAALEASGLTVQEVKEKRGWECILCKK